MTKLEREAKEYADKKADKGNYDYAVGDNVYFSKSAIEHAYVVGAIQREKRIAELEGRNAKAIQLIQRLMKKEKAVDKDKIADEIRSVLDRMDGNKNKAVVKAKSHSSGMEM